VTANCPASPISTSVCIGWSEVASGTLLACVAASVCRRRWGASFDHEGDDLTVRAFHGHERAGDPQSLSAEPAGHLGLHRVNQPQVAASLRGTCP
jgi:hypothetical protein